jgi:hypothetical protein
MAREFINRVQNRRKELDLAITDRIGVVVFLPSPAPELELALKEHKATIADEVQGDTLSMAHSKDAGDWFCAEVEGVEMEIRVWKE